MNKYAVATNIEFMLACHGMSGSELAKRMNVDIMTISRWRNGHRQPSAYAVYQMAKIFGCTMEDIMKGVET